MLKKQKDMTNISSCIVIGYKTVLQLDRLRGKNMTKTVIFWIEKTDFFCHA